MIAPKAARFYLADQLDAKVRIVAETGQGRSVGIAVKKGKQHLLNQIASEI